MNCEQFIHQLGASPTDIGGVALEHAQGCDSCARLMQELNGFDKTLEKAFAIDVPEHLGVHDELSGNVVDSHSGTTSFAGAKRPQWLAVAAVVVLGLGISFGIWYIDATSPLPQSLVAHVRHEPNLLGDSWSVVPAARVEQVLYEGRVSLNGDIGTVRHAGICYFRGNNVAHVVVHTDSGPVTVMLLPKESLQKAMSFDEDGMKGMLIPFGKGSIAVLGDDNAPLLKVRQRVAQNVSWST